MDHFIPKSRGGRNDDDNLVPSCRPCNMDKSNLYLSEWYDKRLALGLPWPPEWSPEERQRSRVIEQRFIASERQPDVACRICGLKVQGGGRRLDRLCCRHFKRFRLHGMEMIDASPEDYRRHFAYDNPDWISYHSDKMQRQWDDPASDLRRKEWSRRPDYDVA